MSRVSLWFLNSHIFEILVIIDLGCSFSDWKCRFWNVLLVSIGILHFCSLFDELNRVRNEHSSDNEHKNWSCKFCHCRFDLFFSFVIVSFIFSIFKNFVNCVDFAFISCHLLFSLYSWECFVLVLSVPFQSLSNLCRTRIWHSSTQWLQFWNETCSF